MAERLTQALQLRIRALIRVPRTQVQIPGPRTRARIMAPRILAEALRLRVRDGKDLRRICECSQLAGLTQGPVFSWCKSWHSRIADASGGHSASLNCLEEVRHPLLVSCPAFIGLGWALSECAKRQKIAEENRLIQKSFKKRDE
jgi:hypothetical protein